MTSKEILEYPLLAPAALSLCTFYNVVLLPSDSCLNIVGTDLSVLFLGTNKFVPTVLSQCEQIFHKIPAKRLPKFTNLGSIIEAEKPVLQIMMGFPINLRSSITTTKTQKSIRIASSCDRRRKACPEFVEGMTLLL